MDILGSDERTLLRNRLLQSGLEGIHNISKSIGTVEYPPWYWRSSYQEIDEYTSKVFFANASSTINEGYDELVITRSKPGSSLFKTDTTCIGCRFIFMCCFCPSLVGTNIVEFSPLMGEKHGATTPVITEQHLEQTCFRCGACDQLVPGRFKKPQYLGMVMAIARHQVPEGDIEGDGCVKVNQFNIYDDMIMRMIDRDDLLVVCSDVIFNGLVNITRNMTMACYDPVEDQPPSCETVRIFSLVTRKAGLATSSVTETILRSMNLRPMAEYRYIGDGNERRVTTRIVWNHMDPETMLMHYLKYGTTDTLDQVKRADAMRLVAAILCNFCG